jgi:hypothetical protein
MSQLKRIEPSPTHHICSPVESVVAHRLPILFLPTRTNFHLWLNTSVERMVRTSGHPTGLHVVATHDGGHQGTAMLTPTTGHVVLSAGAFGTPKLLFRSGIGPADQLQVVQAEKSAMMIKQSDWINHPSRKELERPLQHRYRCLPSEC